MGFRAPPTVAARAGGAIFKSRAIGQNFDRIYGRAGVAHFSPKVNTFFIFLSIAILFFEFVGGSSS